LFKQRTEFLINCDRKQHRRELSENLDRLHEIQDFKQNLQNKKDIRSKFKINKMIAQTHKGSYMRNSQFTSNGVDQMKEEAIHDVLSDNKIISFEDDVQSIQMNPNMHRIKTPRYFSRKEMDTESVKSTK